MGPEADDITLLLPWYVTGRLDDRDVRRVEAVLAGDAARAAELADMAIESDAIAALAGALPGPSPQARLRLFAAIDELDGRPTATTGSSIPMLHPAPANDRMRRHASHVVVKKIGCRV